MTKYSPTADSDRSSSSSRLGYPVLIAIRDLHNACDDAPKNDPRKAPAPAVEAPFQEEILGDDPDSDTEEEASLVPSFASACETHVESTVEETPTTASSSQRVERRQEAIEPATDYIHRPNDSRSHRGQLALQSKLTNRLYLGGMAICLMVAGYWVLNSGSTDGESSPKSTDMFVENTAGDAMDAMAEAPPWDGGRSSVSPAESIVVEPINNGAAGLASSMPSNVQEATPAASNSPVIPAYAGGTPSWQPSFANPASAQEATTSSAAPANNVVAKPADDFIPAFGPSNLDYSNQGQAYGSVPPVAGSSRGSLANNDNTPTTDSSVQFPTIQSASDAQRHWALQEGTLTSRPAPSAAPQAETQLPQIINGSSGHMVENNTIGNQVPHVADNAGQFQFDPRGEQMPDYNTQPYPSANEVQRSASRARLMGIETFESGTR